MSNKSLTLTLNSAFEMTSHPQATFKLAILNAFFSMLTFTFALNKTSQFLYIGYQFVSNNGKVLWLWLQHLQLGHYPFNSCTRKCDKRCKWWPHCFILCMVDSKVRRRARKSFESIPPSCSFCQILWPF